MAAFSPAARAARAGRSAGSPSSNSRDEVRKADQSAACTASHHLPSRRRRRSRPPRRRHRQPRHEVLTATPMMRIATSVTTLIPAWASNWLFGDGARLSRSAPRSRPRDAPAEQELDHAVSRHGRRSAHEEERDAGGHDARRARRAALRLAASTGAMKAKLDRCRTRPGSGHEVEEDRPDLEKKIVVVTGKPVEHRAPGPSPEHGEDCCRRGPASAASRAARRAARPRRLAPSARRRGASADSHSSSCRCRTPRRGTLTPSGGASAPCRSRCAAAPRGSARPWRCAASSRSATWPASSSFVGPGPRG